MKPAVRNTIIAVLAALAAASVIAYLATGMYPFTRFEDPELAQTNESSEISDLFGETGATDNAPEQVESVNAIGLMPSGPGRASISVATVAGPAAAGIVLVWWLGSMTSRRARAGADAPASQSETQPEGTPASEADAPQHNDAGQNG